MFRCHAGTELLKDTLIVAASFSNLIGFLFSSNLVGFCFSTNLCIYIFMNISPIFCYLALSNLPAFSSSLFVSAS